MKSVKLIVDYAVGKHAKCQARIQTGLRLPRYAKDTPALRGLGGTALVILFCPCAPSLVQAYFCTCVTAARMVFQ